MVKVQPRKAIMPEREKRVVPSRYFLHGNKIHAEMVKNCLGLREDITTYDRDSLLKFTT